MATRRTAPPPPPARSAPARSAPAQPKPQVSLPPRPAASRQTFGDQMATRMAAQQTPPPAVQAMAQQAMAQSQRARQNMAPGTGGRGTQQYEAMRQQRAMPTPPMQQGMVPPGGSLPPMPSPGSMQTGPMSNTGAQINRPAPQAMVDAVRASNTGMPLPQAAPGLNMSGVGMKKGGSVKTTRFAEGGGVKEKQEPPIPKATQESMKRQAAQEKADRKQAEEQKAGEKEVKENMGRLGFKKGGSVSSASKRADGCAIRGKTRA